MDLRFLAYEKQRIPKHPECAERWGWYSSTGKLAVKRVRLLKASEEWRDEYQDAKGRLGAGEGQAGGRLETDEPAQSVSKGQPKGSQRAAKGPHARIDHTTHSPSQEPLPTLPSREGRIIKLGEWIRLNTDVPVEDLTVDMVLAGMKALRAPKELPRKATWVEAAIGYARDCNEHGEIVVYMEET